MSLHAEQSSHGNLIRLETSYNMSQFLCTGCWCHPMCLIISAYWKRWETRELARFGTRLDVLSQYGLHVTQRRGKLYYSFFFSFLRPFIRSPSQQLENIHTGNEKNTSLRSASLVGFRCLIFFYSTHWFESKNIEKIICLFVIDFFNVAVSNPEYSS